MQKQNINGFLNNETTSTTLRQSRAEGVLHNVFWVLNWGIIYSSLKKRGRFTLECKFEFTGQVTCTHKWYFVDDLYIVRQII